MSSIQSLSSMLGADLQAQLTEAAANQDSTSVKNLAALYQQTQTQNYLSDLAQSLAADDQAASETLQALAKQVTDTQENFQKAIENSPVPGQTQDLVSTLYPVSARVTATDLTGDSAADTDTVQDAAATSTQDTDTDTDAQATPTQPVVIQDSYDFVQSLYPQSAVPATGTQLDVTV